MALWAIDKDGNRVKAAGIGVPGPVGKTAYQYAVDGGFSGTEEEFSNMLARRSNQNLLINSRWDRRENIINQREQEEYAASGYTIDRWKISGAGSKHLILNENYITIKKDSPETVALRQLFETLPPGQYTLSALFDDIGVLFATLDWDGLNTTYKNASVKIRFMLETNSGFPCYAIFFFGEAAEFHLIAAKLEHGSVQTLAHQDEDGNWVLNDPPPDKALELAKCQRYFERVHITPYDQLVSTWTNDLIARYDYKATKRATPTIIGYPLYVARSGYDDGVFGDQVYKTPNFIAGVDGCKMYFNGIQVNSVDIGHYAYINSTSNLYFDVDANL